MRKKGWVLTLLSLLLCIGTLFMALNFLKQTKAEELMRGIRKIRKGKAHLVPLSRKVTRMLARTDHQSEMLFRNYMSTLGWRYVCNYGRSGLYRQGEKEVLVRKTSLIKDFCIYEVLDENYLNYMKSNIREVA